MKNFTFLKPLFTVGMLVFLVIITLLNFLIFKYLGNWSTVWFIAVQELGMVVSYVIAKGFIGSDTIPWPFAKKWWPEEVIEKVAVKKTATKKKS